MLKVPKISFSPDIRYYLNWYKLSENYYAVYYKNKLVFDFFKGKSGKWFAVWDKSFVRSDNSYWLGLIMSGKFLYENN